MTKSKFVLSVLTATLILFVWNAVTWMVLPFHSNTHNNIPEQAIDFGVLKKELHKDGIYHYPGLPSDNSTDSWQKLEEKLKSGPRITLMVYKSGQTDLFSIKQFLLNICFNFITSLLTLTLLTKLALKNRASFIYITLSIGLIVCFAKTLPLMTWYLFPLDYVLTELLDTIISFILIGTFFGLYTFKNRLI